MKNTIMKVGDRYESKSGGWVEVIKYDGAYNVTVRFDATGTEIIAPASDIRRGNIKDKMNPCVYGVGFEGIGEYKPTVNKEMSKEYALWISMFNRCYSDKYQEKKPTYIGCSVHPDWHNFQVFAEWLQDNYIEGYQLDKDLLVKGNKVYGPDTCIFVTRQLNMLFCDSATIRGEYPIGVYAKRDRFAAKITLQNKPVSLGHFDTPEEAHAAWVDAKAKEILRQASLPTTPIKLRDALVDAALELS